MMSFLDSAQSAPSDKLAPPPDFEKYIAPAREQREKVGAQLEQSEKDSDTAVAKFNETAKNKPPEFQPVPSPDVVETSPAKVWGSAAMLLAAVGSAFTRRPMVTAMNAAAKTITGFQQGDLEATQQGYDSWKIANENAIKAHQFQIDQYKEALDVAKEDVVAGSAKMRALAAQFHDAYMLEASQTRDYQAMLDKYNGEAEQLQRFQATLPRLNTLANQAKQLLQYRDNFIAASKSLAEAKKSNDPAKVQLAQDAFDEAKTELSAFVPTLQAKQAKGSQLTPAQQEKARIVGNTYKSALDEIDKAITMAQNPNVSGGRGLGSRLLEAGAGFFSPNQKTPASDFETQITKVRDSMRNLLALGKYMSPGALEQMEKLVRGTSLLDTKTSTVDSLMSLKNELKIQQGIAKADLEKDQTEQPDQPTDDLSSLSDEQLLERLK